MLGQAVEVLLLLSELLLELQELLLLALADSVVLVGLLSSLESITDRECQHGDRGREPIVFNDAVFETYPAPPILGGAPVSPSAIARAVVLKQRRGRMAEV